MYRKELSPEAALQKLKQFCSYQERCHSEVKQKLFQLPIRSRFHDEIIASLIEENYLNEERFTIQYAGGKFRMKQWGRNKISASLKQKQISPYCIKKGLASISDEEYTNTLVSLIKKRYASLKEEQYLIRKKKTIDYLLQKGFEASLVIAETEKHILQNKTKK